MGGALVLFIIRGKEALILLKMLSNHPALSFQIFLFLHLLYSLQFLLFQPTGKEETGEVVDTGR